MKINVTKEAASWYIEELDIQKTAQVRFYVRYGGFGGVIPGFSLGVGLDTPNEIHASCEVDHVTFYVEEKDAWYFEEKDLEVTYNNKRNEPSLTYI